MANHSTPPAPSDERSKLAGRAGVVGLGTLLSRILGLGRDMALAACFSREATDAFFVAFTIPNALRQLLGEGAVSSAVVPVLTTTIEKEGDEEARSFFAKTRGLSLVALTVVTILGVVFARPLTELFASGFHSRPGQFERTVAMTRVVFPYIFFMGTAALGMAALNAKKHFAVAAFAPGLLNVAFMVGAFALPPIFIASGWEPSISIAAAALVGGLLQVVAQWPALRRIGYFTAPKWDLSDPRVREIGKRMAPMMLGIGVYYIDLVISRRFLSELGEGAQSYFTWAMRVCDFPQGIFVMAISTAALPSLSSLAAKNEGGELRKTFSLGMRLSLFVAIPASVALMFLAEPLIVALFQRGAFTAESAHETARALMWQGGAIWTVAAVRQLVPMFYALGDTKTPVWVSAADLIVFIVLAFSLRNSFGHVGVSMAVAGSSFAQMVLLALMLKKKLGRMEEKEIGLSAAKAVVASFGAGVVAWFVSDIHFGSGAVGRALPGMISGVVFLAVFVAIAKLFKSAELETMTGGISRRLARGRTSE